MPDPGQPAPAEEEQADETRLEKKRHQPFDGERHAEDVADIMGVISPVRAELEFHGEAGGYPHGDVYSEQQSPIFRHVAPDRAAGHDINALHDPEQDREPERQRYEQEMIHRRQAELERRQLDGRIIDHGSPLRRYTSPGL